MGKKDGFNNELTKKLHDISTAVIPKTKMSVHENVPEYGEDAYLVAETGFQIQQALFPGKALLKYLCLFSVTMLYSGVVYEFKKWSVVPGALALHLSGSLHGCLESLPVGTVHGESSTTRRKWCGIAFSLFKRLLRCCYFHVGPHWKCHRQHFLLQVTKRSQSVHGLWRPCHLLKELTWRLFDRNVPRNNFLISLQILNIDAVLKQQKEHLWLSTQILESGISANGAKIVFLFHASCWTHIIQLSVMWHNMQNLFNKNACPIASRSYMLFCTKLYIYLNCVCVCVCVYCKTTTVCCSDLFRDLNIFIS